MGKTFIVAGLVMVLVGLLILVGDKLPLKFGQFPGDIIWRGKSTTVYFPLATCLVLSILGSLIFWFIQRK